MEQKLRKILDILSAINSDSNFVTKDDLNEQYENLNDFKSLTNNLEVVLEKFELININDSNKMEEILFEFHRIITTFEWHFSEISELNTKILKAYGEKID